MMEYREESKQELIQMFEEKETPERVASELDIPTKEVLNVYTEWKQEKMDKVNLGDRVCYVLNIKGYKSQLVHGNVISKKTNSVIVESSDNAYVKEALNGKVVVSIKDILVV